MLSALYESTNGIAYAPTLVRNLRLGKLDKDDVSNIFVCRKCGQVVSLYENGSIPVFRHSKLEEPRCLYGHSFHRNFTPTKFGLLNSLSKRQEVKNLDVEKIIDGEIADIYFELKDEFKIAILLTYPKIHVKDITRTYIHFSKRDIYCLYILPWDPPYFKVKYLKDWEIYLHAMYFSRLYYYYGEDMVRPVNHKSLTFMDYSYGKKKLISKCIAHEEISIIDNFHVKDIKRGFKDIFPGKIFIDHLENNWYEPYSKMNKNRFIKPGTQGNYVLKVIDDEDLEILPRTLKKYKSSKNPKKGKKDE